MTPEPAHGAAPLKVFISYARRDKAHRARLREATVVLERDEQTIEVWDDQVITAGQDWDSLVMEALDAADIVLVLVSQRYIASPYCFENELPRALERHRRRVTRIIPIIVQDCDWRNTPLAALQALPAEGKPIAAWALPDSGWDAVSRGIRAVVQELLGKRPRREARPPAPREEPGREQPPVVTGPSEEAVRAKYLVDAWITPLARLFGRSWLEGLADVRDDALHVLLARLVAAVPRAKADRPASVIEDLAFHLERHPAATDELWQAIRLPMIAVEREAGGPMRRLTQIYAQLTFAFDRVKFLGRPLALPGFFNGPLCVAVLQSLATDAPLLEPCSNPRPEPWVRLGGDDEYARGIPRVWVLRVESEFSRDTLCSDLNGRFVDLSWSAPAETIMSRRAAEPVERILAGRICIACRRGDEHSRTNVPRDPDGADFHAIDGLDGIRAMFDSLAVTLERTWRLGPPA